MWLNICQGLLLSGFVARFLGTVIYAVNGRAKVEPSGALGVFVTIVWTFFAGLVLWRAGALTTIVGTP